MRILAIETSCDETSVAVLEAKAVGKKIKWKILSNIVHSQIDIHKEWGGVVPNLAKREHVSNLVPFLGQAIKDANLDTECPSDDKKKDITKILQREELLIAPLLKFVDQNEKPKIDLLAVTSGPGLEPALWVGINFAKALSKLWDIPLMPVNHMDGHFLSALLPKETGVWTTTEILFPAIGLLISGGHTEIIFAKDIHSRKILGQTRDDAVGEAFDKVARMMGMPYPGGPEISKLAKQHKKFGDKFVFPRPMIKSPDFDFSFSGLKTSVLYRIKSLNRNPTKEEKEEICFQFEEAVKDVLIIKLSKAILQFKPKTILVGGGVIANQKIRVALTELNKKEFPNTILRLPDQKVTGDNAVMIAVSAFVKLQNLKYKIPKTIKANGSWRIDRNY